jgi:hypothetical protein
MLTLFMAPVIRVQPVGQRAATPGGTKPCNLGDEAPKAL